MDAQLLQPEHEIDFPLFSKIIYHCWPRNKFNKLDNLLDCKHFYNQAYNRLIEELGDSLNKFHPAAWVREGYLQLELWSLMLYKKEYNNEIANLSGPSVFVAVGRYGWRYVIEISLERINETEADNVLRPQKNDISKIFTILVGLNYCSEYSNYLHYFKDYLSSVTIIFSPFIFTVGPLFNESEFAFNQQLREYVGQKTDFKTYKSFAVDNSDRIMQMIDEMLLSYFGFVIKEIENLAEVFINEISPEIGASVLVTTYNEGVLLLSSYSSLPASKVASILNFVLLDTKSSKYANRDFLSRSQTKRMLNYAGVVIYLNSHLETIYSKKASKFDFVIESNRHIILSGSLLAEWLQTFISRLVYGQRQDLKDINGELNKTVSAIEHYFHRNIFETKLKNMIAAYGFLCTSIEKINGIVIPCGEIDIIAYNPEKNILLIIEAKSQAPAKDARSMGKNISDHFKQKKYHQKFISKISWVKNNIDSINVILAEMFKFRISAGYILKKYFVTGSPNAIKFLIEEYSVVTFYELDKLLKDAHRS
jgi:hypothetical protein